MYLRVQNRDKSGFTTKQTMFKKQILCDPPPVGRVVTFRMSEGDVVNKEVFYPSALGLQAVLIHHSLYSNKLYMCTSPGRLHSLG